MAAVKFSSTSGKGEDTHKFWGQYPIQTLPQQVPFAGTGDITCLQIPARGDLGRDAMCPGDRGNRQIIEYGCVLSCLPKKNHDSITVPYCVSALSYPYFGDRDGAILAKERTR